jgi:UDP-N-acetylglucosamine 2-epimerase
MEIASVVGARPNFVKLAPVSSKLREMDRIFFEELGIPNPDYHLNIGSGRHMAMEVPKWDQR